jgi:ERCC4-type nuclease
MSKKRHKKLTPIIDTREKPDYRYNFSLDYFNEPVIRKLDTGDYSIEEMDVIIERKKTVQEVAQNMCEKRMKDVIERLSSFKYKFFLCEFEYRDVATFPYSCDLPASIKRKLRRISPGWITSFLLDLNIKHGIPVIYAGSQKHAEYLAGQLLLRCYGQENNTSI